MNASERRKEIKKILLDSSAAVSAGALASKLGVSRQIVVGDVALLRASGENIFATPRGYLLQRDRTPGELLKTLSCRHTKELLKDELYTVVDFGGSLVDVIVEHPIYGEIRGNLHISSRYEADLFLEKLQSNEAYPLCSLTSGVHLHTINCPNEDVFIRISQTLKQKGILWED